MVDLKKYNGFEWDKGNISKSYQKHGISPKESEETFLDKNLQVEVDIKHQQVEQRCIAIGKTIRNKVLFIIFTLRNKKIRIISARQANKTERRLYEKEIKDNSKI